MLESRVFDSFSEASAFAKELAQQGINHNLKRTDGAWLVEYDKSGDPDSSQNADIERLRQELEGRDVEIENLINQVRREREKSLSTIQKLEEGQETLRQELDAVQSCVKDEVAKRMDGETRKLEQAKDELEREQLQVRQQADDLAYQKHKMELLEKAYAERFGEAEVKVVKENVLTSREVCPMCVGDGGVRGGCQKCGRSGWIDVTEERIMEKVEISERKDG